MSSSLKVLLEYVECVFYACKIKGNFKMGSRTSDKKTLRKICKKH